MSEYYTIQSNPVYSSEIRKLKNTDPANAEQVFNPLIETLINNTASVKQGSAAAASAASAAQSKADSAYSLASTAKAAADAAQSAASGGAPTNHASSGTSYGLGTTSNYGHVKTINGLTQSSHADGTALSAYQGYLLNTGKLNLSGGTMTGTLTANNNTSYTTAQVRNIYATTSDLTAGSSSLASGSICLVYE